MARRLLRQLLEHGLGAPGRALLAWRTRGQAERLLAQRRLTGPSEAVARALDDVVARGPFVGLRYPRRRGDIVHAAKLLGSYECELHGVLERLLARVPQLVVNVGSGDGYYAVGIARRLAAAGRHARVVAVDPDPLAQRSCRETARMNVVADLLQPKERIDATALERVLHGAKHAPRGSVAGGPAKRPPPRSLIIVDAEGYEDALLDPSIAPTLVDADLLVETHDFAAGGVTARLTARFEATHDVERIEVSARDVADFPELASVAPSTAAGLLDEFRHLPQSWLACFARAAH